MNRLRLLVVSAICIANASARAADDESVSSSDYAEVAIAGTLWAAPEIFIGRIVRRDCTCDENALPTIDKPYAGRRDDQMAMRSNRLVGALALAPISWLVGEHISGADTVFRDAMTITKSLLFSGASNELVKISAQRPRPLLYGLPQDDPARDVPDNYLSFFSAHTSNVAAAGFAFARVYSWHSSSVLAQSIVYGSVGAATIVTGISRVRAGKHFPTDVVAGAVSGGAIGLLTPRLGNAERDKAYLEIRPNALVLTIPVGRPVRHDPVVVP